MAMARTMPPLAVPSSLVRTMPVTWAASVKSLACLQAVLASCRVHDEEGLMWGAGNQLGGGAAHLVQLFHQVGLGVEAAGGVDDEDLGGTGFGGGAGVVERGGGVAALPGLDDGDVGAGGPDLELLDGGGAEGVGGAEQDGTSLSGEVGGELAGGGGLAGAVDADHHDDLGRRVGMVDGPSDAVEDGFELGFEELLELVAALDSGAEGALAEVFEDQGGGGGSDVGGEQDGFEVVEGGGVDPRG